LDENRYNLITYKMKKILVFSTLIILLLFGGCCVLFPKKCNNINGSYETISNNITIPEYKPLNIPISEIPLPAFFIGDLLSGGCFKSGTPITTVTAVDSLRQKAERSKRFETELKTEFEKAAIKANLDASITRALTQQFDTKIYGMKVVQVDPANTLPNLINPNCNSTELDYFVDKRTVVIAGLKADSIVVKMNSGLTAEQKAKVDAAIDSLNLKLGLSFGRAISSVGEFSFSGRNLFFGALVSTLKALQYKQSYDIRIKAGGTIQLSYIKGKYTVLISRPSFSNVNRLTFNFYDNLNNTITTGPQDIDFEKGHSYIVADNRRVNLTVIKRGKNEYLLNITMLIVGISGKE
jgi:hypothetical protein